MTTATLELPALNVDLVSDILIWAAQDAGVLPKPIRLFDGWGSWNQSVWAEVDPDKIEQNVCGTAFCMAGQAAVQTGHRFVYEGDGTAERAYPAAFKGLGEDGRPIYVPVGEPESVSTIGRKSLGIADFEADAFFNGDNEFGKIAALALGFARVRGVELNVEPEILAAAKEWLEDNFVEFLDLVYIAPWNGQREEYARLWNANGAPQTCASCGQSLPKE
jgi:hypothetical protein